MGGVGGAEGPSSLQSLDFCLLKAARALRFARFISRELSGFVVTTGTSSCTGLCENTSIFFSTTELQHFSVCAGNSSELLKNIPTKLHT